MVRLSIAAIFACLLAAAVGRSDEYAQFPGPPIDGSTLRFKQKVEEIYASGNYERALLIYEKELAPQGDKYAQYMVGYMHLTGRGVVPDPAKALAWYRLAAERGEPKFIEARDALEGTLAAGEQERAQSVFSELWQRHGDRRIILEMIEEDLELLGQREPAGLVGGAASGADISAGYSGNGPGNPYYRRVRAQLGERVRYLDSMPDDPSGVDDSAMDAFEADLRRQLEALDLP